VPLTLTNAIALATLGGSAGYSLALRGDEPVWHYSRVAAWAIILRAKQTPPSSPLSDAVSLAAASITVWPSRPMAPFTNWGASYCTISTTPVILSNNAVSLSAGWDHTLALCATERLLPRETNEWVGPG